MSFLTVLLSRPRLVLSFSLLLATMGFVAWKTMPRQEDPRLPARWAFLSTPYPGADAEDVERLLLEPIEKALVEMEEVVRIESTARAGVAISEIELAPDIYDTDQAWNEVRRALANARADFPSGVGTFELNDDVVSPESVVLAITGSSDTQLLLDAAKDLKRELLTLPLVKRIRILGDPGEEVLIKLDDAAARQLSLDHRFLARQLRNRNTSQSAGALRLSGQRLNLRIPTTFDSIAEIANAPIFLGDGSVVPLGSVAMVKKEPRSPPMEIMRFNGQAAVGLSIIPKQGIDIVAFGRELREGVSGARHAFPRLSIREAMFQPDRVAERTEDLGWALVLGILIVAGVLFLTMGLRMGVVVSAIIPLVVLSSLACYAGGDGILHQISIAALVISLGLIVDNAIVIVEASQRNLEAGLGPAEAVRRAVRELAIPLATSTGTTIAAFLPMYLSQGTTADFVRAIPVVVTTCLVISYVFAISVTPILSRHLLIRGRSRGDRVGVRFSSAVARAAVMRPGIVLLCVGLMVGICAISMLRVEKRFFPAADRNQVIVTLELPEGTHILTSDRSARQLERMLVDDPEVLSVTTFVGRSAPLFYYNINRRPKSPHIAQLVIETSQVSAIVPVSGRIRRFARTELVEATVGVRRLTQGMPIDAAIEVRLYGPDQGTLEGTTEAVLALLRQIPGTVDVHHNLGLGAPTLEFRVNDAAASRHRISRKDIALTLLGRSSGLPVGEYRAGVEPIPIVIRSLEGEEFPVSRIPALQVTAPGIAPVSLAEVAQVGIGWRTGAIHHRDLRDVVTVSSHLEEGTASHRVLRELKGKLASLKLPSGVYLEFGGEAEGSSSANAELFRNLPIGLLLILFCLLAEFNSFRVLGIILVTVPLSIVGIVPGLLLSGKPFGFMSLLGAVSLVGIVVNNAIVLLDVIERHRSNGESAADAVMSAVRLRARPILLTALTTAAGLLPLAFSGTELWPPMAWAMISGLAASTVLSLAAVPALYVIAFRSRGPSPAQL